MIAFKKLLPFLIIVVVIAAAGAGLYWQKQWQKTHIPLDISAEAVSAKCLDETSKMTDEQIIEQINTLPFATGEELGKINDLTGNYLVCDLKLNPSEENYNKTKENILKIKAGDEFHKSNIARLEILYPNLQRMRDLVTSFSALLATEERESMCPQNKPTSQFMELCLRGSRKSLPESIKIEQCNMSCERLSRYYTDKEVYNREILNFSEWFDEWTKEGDYSGLGPRYSWRSAVAYHLGGEDAALKVCGNLPSIKTVRDDCTSGVENFKKLKGEKKSCNNTFKELTVMICQVR